MNCKHCGKEIPDDAKYCMYCAEPVVQRVQISPEIREKTKYGVETFFYTLIIFPITIVIYYLWKFAEVLFAIMFRGNPGDVECWDFWAVCLLAVGICAAVVVVRKILYECRSEKEQLIAVQYNEDQTSICPHCGCHDVKVYRKGYNYSKGYWLRKHGGGYVAGMDSNRARCRCQNCGHDWLTDYDYRLLK